MEGIKVGSLLVKDNPTQGVTYLRLLRFYCKQVTR
jgi:hypothetical protein